MTEDEVLTEIQAVLDKHNYKLGYELSFPIYRTLPEEVQLALHVIKRHGMKIDIIIQEKTK